MATGTDQQGISDEKSLSTGAQRSVEAGTTEPDPLLAVFEREVAALMDMCEDPETTAVVDAVEGELSRVLAKGTKSANEQNKYLTENPSLQRFKADYDKLPAHLKAKCPWEIGLARLLANGGEKLRLAQAMEQGGILFGVDKNGKLLFADKGEEPIMKGINYKDTRDRVLFKHDRLDKLGKMELDGNKQPIPTGYTMFPYEDDYKKSYEIIQYESFTGYHFIRPFRLKRFFVTT